MKDFVIVIEGHIDNKNDKTAIIVERIYPTTNHFSS